MTTQTPFQVSLSADELDVLLCAPSFQIALKQINSRLQEIKSDDRFLVEPANVFVNAPLAIVQIQFETEKRTLEWVLRMLQGGA